MVHSHVYNVHVLAVLAARLAGVASVMHHHKSYVRERTHRHWMMRGLSALASVHVALDSILAADIARAYRVKPQRIKILPNAVDTEAFQPAEDRETLRRELGLPLTGPLIGTAASLTPPKNHSYNLRMAAALKKMGFQGAVLFFGEGPLRQALEQEAVDIGVADIVHFMGAKRPLHPWMRALDLFIMGSAWEGQPLGLFQAAACGLPIVATRIPGNISALGETYPGLVPLNQPEIYAATVLQTLQNFTFRQTILRAVEQARIRVPNLDQFRTQVAEIYQSACRRLKSV